MFDPRRSRTILFASVALAAVLEAGPPLRAQVDPAPCTSFSQLAPDAGDPLSYTVPLRYGSFADVEIGASGGQTIQLQVEVFEDTAIKDRRTWVVIPGRVVLLSEVLGAPNLFQLGSALVLHVTTSSPVSAVMVRRD